MHKIPTKLRQMDHFRNKSKGNQQIPCNNSSESTLKTRPLVQMMDSQSTREEEPKNQCNRLQLSMSRFCYPWRKLCPSYTKERLLRANAMAGPGSVCSKVWRCAKWEVRVLNWVNPCGLWKCSTTMIISKINGLWTIIKADCWDFVETLRGWRLIAWEWESCPAQAAG